MKFDFDEKIVVLTVSEFEEKAARAGARILKRHPPKDKREFNAATQVLSEFYAAICAEIFEGKEENANG